jgi:hypothetical protein
MEADWSVEIGPDLPCIDSPWEGFVDLRPSPQAIDTLAEAVKHPALRKALLALNTRNSPLFTIKCDAWTVSGGEIDADEFGTDQEHAYAGFASYIDILERNAEHFSSFAFHEHRMRELTPHLRRIDLRNGRVDLVLRTAFQGEHTGCGLTLYAAGCGATEADAYSAWQAVLAAAVAATITAAAHPLLMGE